MAETSRKRAKRKPWWTIVESRPSASKTYHYLNVAGKGERPICVTTADLDQGTGAFVTCLFCISNTCEHARFVAECVTMGVTTIGEERHRDSAPPPTTPPPDIDQWRIDDE